MRRLRGVRGTANALIIVAMTGVMILAAGLAFDGSRVLAARREAVDLANQAARAGAQAVEVGGVRAGRVGLDPRTAAEVANQFVAATGHHGSAVAGGTTVVVTVDITVDLPLLSAAGLSSTTVTGRGSARIVRGISEAER
ncbi:MAG TPA: pilus assembly protein TadG-related protein [Acidimicrobiales bacterium]|jgi:hypothetical protein